MRGEEKRSSSKRCVRVRKSAYDSVLYVRSPPADAYVADAYVRVCVCVIYRAYIHRVSHLSSADISSRILTALSAQRRPSRCNLKPARVRRTLKCLGQMKNGAARDVASPLRKIAVTFSKPISRRLYYFIYSSIYFSVIYSFPPPFYFGFFRHLATPILLLLLPTLGRKSRAATLCISAHIVSFTCIISVYMRCRV